MHQRHIAVVDSRDGGGGAAAGNGGLSLASGDETKSSPQRPKVRRRFRRSFSAYTNVGNAASPLLILFMGCCGGILLFSCAVYVGILIATTSSNNDKAKGKSKLIHLDPNDYSRAVDDTVPALPYNEIYRIPESIPMVGDRSDRYAELRREIDAVLPDDPRRSLEFVRRLHGAKPSFDVVPMSADAHHSDQVHREEDGLAAGGADDSAHQQAYDIYDCPATVPEG